MARALTHADGGTGMMNLNWLRAAHRARKRGQSIKMLAFGASHAARSIGSLHSTSCSEPNA